MADATSSRLSSRPVCTCAPHFVCPAEAWWEKEGKFQALYADQRIPQEAFIPPPAPPEPIPPPRDYIWQALRDWIQQNDRLPNARHWDQVQDAPMRPAVSKNLIYKTFGSLQGLYDACLKRGVATKKQYHHAQERAHRRAPRARKGPHAPSRAPGRKITS